jgi:hypothetical protein
MAKMLSDLDRARGASLKLRVPNVETFLRKDASDDFDLIVPFR